MRLLISFLFTLLFTSSAFATTYYVRDGGAAYGTSSTTCNGLTNAVYTTGNGPNCAVSNPGYILGYNCGYGGGSCGVAGHLSSQDTLFIDGDSDTTPGTQAQYNVGYGSPQMPSCSSGSASECTLGNIPAGTDATHTTSIIGTGTNRPQIYAPTFPWQVINIQNNYVTLQNVEITAHHTCGYNNPVTSCTNGEGSNRTSDGLYIGGTGITITDVYVHGMSHYGVETENLGSVTFTRMWLVGNGYGGMSTGTSAAVSGTLTFNQPIIEWSGCLEAYPLTNAGIDNHLNYSGCFGQSNSGYGDGLAFGNDGTGNAGSWTLIGPGSISWNTQDGLDTLHGNSSGTIQIDKMRFEGNAGNQVKMNAVNEYLTNSIIVGNCGWWDGAAQSASGAMGPGDSCRAEGGVIIFNVINNSNTRIYNNTIYSNGQFTFTSEDVEGIFSGGASGGCNGSTSIDLKNNIVYGGYSWIDDTSFGGSSNHLTGLEYNNGNDFNGGGTCGLVGNGAGGVLVWGEDYDDIYNHASSNAGCSGAHSKCQVLPGFVSTLLMGSAGGNRTTYYTAWSGISFAPINNGGGAYNAGVNGLTYWHTENDYYNSSRSSSPSMGGLELSSCAISTYGCFLNSDCCNNTCTNNLCAGSCTSNGGSSTPGPCCSSLSSGGICVACYSNTTSCSQNSDCCSGVCSGSVCVAATSSGSYKCFMRGYSKLIGGVKF